jgi:hypothetical protein
MDQQRIVTGMDPYSSGRPMTIAISARKAGSQLHATSGWHSLNAIFIVGGAAAVLSFLGEDWTAGVAAWVLWAVWCSYGR